MWKQLKPKTEVEPLKVVRHIGFTYKDELFIQAGTTLKENLTLEPTDVLKIFNFKTNKWRLNYDVCNPKKRTGHSFVKFNNKIFIFGGTTGSRVYLNDLLEFDLETCLFSNEIHYYKGISDRFGQTSGLINESMIIFGGMFFSFQTLSWKYFNDFYEINLITKEYKRIAFDKKSDEIEKIGAHASIENEKKNEIFIFGGLNSQGRSNKLYSLKKKDDEYILKDLRPDGEIPCGRAGSAISIYLNQIFISGGYDGENALNDIYKYDIKSNFWIRIKYDLPYDIRLHSMSLRKFNEGFSLVIFGGVGKNDDEHHGEILELMIDCDPFMKNLSQNSNYLDIDIIFKC